MEVLEDFIRKTLAVETPEEAFSLYTASMRQYGYDQIVYSLITDHPSMGKAAGHGVLSNYPEDWMRFYQDNGYRLKDPVPKYAFTITTPFTWADMERSRSLTKTETLVMRQAEDAGLNDGVGVPLYGPSNEIAGVGLASTVQGIKPDRFILHAIRARTLQFHMVYGELQTFRVPLESNIELTNREAEVILWVSEGKSDPDIATILGITVPTVRFHLNNVFSKLKVNERTLAVVKALRLGLIAPMKIRNPYQGQ